MILTLTSYHLTYWYATGWLTVFDNNNNNTKINSYDRRLSRSSTYVPCKEARLGWLASGWLAQYSDLQIRATSTVRPRRAEANLKYKIVLTVLYSDFWCLFCRGLATYTCTTNLDDLLIQRVK